MAHDKFPFFEDKSGWIFIFLPALLGIFQLAHSSIDDKGYWILGFQGIQFATAYFTLRHTRSFPYCGLVLFLSLLAFQEALPNQVIMGPPLSFRGSFPDRHLLFDLSIFNALLFIHGMAIVLSCMAWFRHRITMTNIFLAFSLILLAGVAWVAPAFRFVLLIGIVLASILIWKLKLAEWLSACRPGFIPTFSILTIVLLYFATGAYQARETIPIPHKAARFLCETEVSGEIYIASDWRPFVKRLLAANFFLKSVNQISPKTNWLLVASRAEAIRSGQEWKVAFENNLSTIFIRNVSENEANFEKLRGYYGNRKVPFDTNEGFQFGKASFQASSWIESFDEKPNLGKYAPQRVISRRALEDATFYLSRGATRMAIVRLTYAIEADPRNPYLALKLEEALTTVAYWKDAKSWLETIDKLNIPDELLPIVQGLRYGLGG